MLQFILGKGGTGKTTYIKNEILNRVNNGEKNIIMLVPDQSSFDTEKSFLTLLGAKKTKQVNVFGFSKLCRYVFEKTGNVPHNVIDNGTRSVLMNLAIEQLSEKLTLFSAKGTKSLSEVMLQTLTECRKNSVTAQMLRTGAEKVGGGTLKQKLYETALILDTYDSIVSQSYIDPLDDLDRLYNILTDSNIFEDYILYIDSFSGFTAQQLNVLRVLMNRCSEVYIALTLDPVSRGNEEVFETSYKTYRLITDLAKRDFIDIKKPVEFYECYRFKSDELKLLESGVYRSDYEKCEKAPLSVRLYSARDVYNECEYVARQIKRLVIEEGYFYSDISVIAHDTEPYNGILNVIFDKYEIPYFMDIKKDIEVRPVVRFVLTVFRIVLNNFDREDVIALLKTGLVPCTTQEVSAFENYAYVWNVNGSGFKEEFDKNPDGFSDKLSDDANQKLAEAEKVRKQIVEPLLEFKSECKDKNGAELTELLYELLAKIGVQQSLSDMYDMLTNEDEGTAGAEQIRIWNMLMDVLDKMVAVVGEMPLSIKRYYELLSVQISSLQLAEIPQTLDSVTVTTAQRVRLSNRRASFLIGCTDGQFPAVPHISGVFSSYELKILSNNDISISEDFSDLNNLEMFMAYSCITSASEKLFVIYPLADLLGNIYKPSSIVDEVRKIYPEIITEEAIDFDIKKECMWAIQPAFEIYAADLKGSGSQELRDIFANDAYYSQRLSALDRAVDNSPFVLENDESSRKLFGENMRISASQIEKFNLCRFSYFCNYGLKIRERRRAEINPMEYGTLVHYVLERFFESFSKIEYSSMSEDGIAEFVTDTLKFYTENYFGGADTKSGSFVYKLKVVRQNLCLLLSHIIAELSQSDFDVADCELKIGSDIPAYTIKLPTGESIAVCGSIDRVDIMEQDGVKYLRVVDYKTGSKKFKLSDILFGLNLQMLLYLYSTQSNGTKRYGEVLPAGILYMPASEPNITAEADITEDSINDRLNNEFKMNGLLLDDINVIRGMDKTEKGKYIPVKINAKKPDESLATLEQFGKIFSKLDMLVADMGKELYGGNIQASPAKGAHDACEYCPYDSVCAYHMSSPKNTFNMKNEEVFRKIDEDAKAGEC